MDLTLTDSAVDELINTLVPEQTSISRGELLDVVRELVQAGHKIYAVKLVRTLTSHGLCMSKAVVDLVQARADAKQRQSLENPEYR